MRDYIKIVFVLFLAFAMLLSAAACGAQKTDVQNTTSANTQKSLPASDSSSKETASNAKASGPYVWKPDPADLEWKKGTSPVKFNAFMNVNYTKPWRWDTDVAKEITKRTGVSIDAVYSPDNDGTKLNIMLASGDKLPDFLVWIDRTTKIYQRMVKDGVLWSLTELMDKYAPKMREVLPKGYETFNAEEKDGQLYIMGRWALGADQVGDSRVVHPPTFSVRNDIWAALGKPQIKTPEDIYNFGKQIKEKYPDVKYPIYFNFINTAPVPLASMFGYPGSMWSGSWYYDYKNDKPLLWVEHPAAKEGYKFANKLFREGICNPEQFTVTDFKDELKKGSIAMYNCFNIFDIYAANGILKQKNPAEFYQFIPAPVKDGCKFELLNNFLPYSIGPGVVITKDCKNPERAIKYLEFMCSDEGQQLVLYGINGVHHDMKQTEQGWSYPVFKEEIAKLISTDFNKLFDYGIYDYMGIMWFYHNLYDFTFAYGASQAEANKLMREGNTFYTSNYKINNRIDGIASAVLVPPDSNENVQQQKILDYLKNQIAKVLTAKSDAEFESLYKNMLDDLQKQGIEQVRAVYSRGIKDYINKANKMGLELVKP